MEKRALKSLNIIFCSDKELRQINKSYLGRTYFTDVISFDLSDDAAVEGEIYISVERVRENARNLNESVSKELKRVIFHGILHLCGYKDNSSSDKLAMRRKEDVLLARYKSSHGRST